MDNLRRIRQMDEWLQGADGLSPHTRRAAEHVVTSLKNEWQTRQQKRYDDTVKVRDERFSTLVNRASDEAVSELEQLAADVQAGRIAPEKARGQLRDFMAEHNRLTDLYNEIVKQDAHLEELAAKEPEDLQEEMMTRFPATIDGMQDMATLVGDHLAAEQARAKWSTNPTPYVSHAPGADEMTRAGLRRG